MVTVVAVLQFSLTEMTKTEASYRINVEKSRHLNVQRRESSAE